MNKDQVSKLFDTATLEDFHSFKEAFNNVFNDELNSVCESISKDVDQELSMFGVVEEGISIPLPNNPNVKDAHLFAIESDNDNMVVKFKVNGEEKSFNAKDDDKEFYKNLSESSMDDFDEATKKKIAIDMNEFMVKTDKKDESIERGEPLKAKEVKMEADLSKLSGDARLKALKKMGDKIRNAKSKEMNKDEK